MNILIVKLSSIGDIVHTLPALVAIRRGLPDASITWAVDARYAEILRGNTMIDNLVEIERSVYPSANGGPNITLPVDSGLSNLMLSIRSMRNESFDVAIDFQGLIKSAFLARLSTARQRWGFSKEGLREPLGRLLMTDTAATTPKVHVVRKNLELAAGALGVEIPDADYEFPISTGEQDVREAESIVGSAAGERFAILNPGGGWVTKLWSAANYGLLADRLWDEFGLASILTVGPGEDSLADLAAANSRSGTMTIAKPGLKAFYELAKRASIYIGGDTGPTHIAIATKTPVVGLFGPTEWWRNGSTNPEDICVERNNIDCRTDCHRRKCDRWICMDIDVETVVQAVGRRLRQDPLSPRTAEIEGEAVIAQFAPPVRTRLSE